MDDTLLSLLGFGGMGLWCVFCRAVYYKHDFGRYALFLTDGERERLGRPTTRSRRRQRRANYEAVRAMADAVVTLEQQRAERN